jgi:hypothetical protein
MLDEKLTSICNCKEERGEKTDLYTHPEKSFST